MVLGKNLKIYHKPADNQRPFSVIVEGRGQNEALYFESGVAATLNLEELEGLKQLHQKICDAYSLLGVLTYNAGTHRILYLVLVSSCVSVGKLPSSTDAETEILRITGVTAISLRNDPGDEDRLVELIKLLSSGIFFFAVSTNPNATPLDLTVCAQRAALGAPTDNRFFWNRGLHLYVQSFGISCDKWLVKIICGGVEIKTLYAGQYQARACMISRFNCYRAGTRFQVRGANDDGNVANFVETEQMISLGDQVISYVQIRGSVPLFWEQTGVQVGAHKIKFSRSFETMSPAFERHLNMIRREYGDQILINLLGNKEGETGLSEAYQKCVAASPYHAGMLYIHFDYHANVRGGRPDALVRDLQEKIAQRITEFGFFHHSQEGGITRQQTGTARTNCLDCLDRTNAVQTFIGLMVLGEQMKALGLADKPQVASRFQQLFAQLWTQNGDHVSRIYAGTGALDGKNKIKDGARSVSRTFQNNLFDTSKQEAMDILLAGALLNSDYADRARTVLPFNLRQVPAFLLNSLFARAPEFTSTVPLTFWVGTWNVNGGKHTKISSHKEPPLDDWLWGSARISRENGTNYLLASWDIEKPVDIFAVGFEEIVDLNAQNIMYQASKANQQQWLIDITAVLHKKGHYVLVHSVQLVGVCLFVFIQAKHVPYLRDVATAMVKTGLGGATGNKGGVAIRFQLYNSSLCFCCSHFAAGQSNVNERNADFVEISNKLVFPADLLPHSHDFVFWCGDFNYRIDMANEVVKEYIRNENWPALVEGDQLTFSKNAQKCFDDYVEAPLLFGPTYKFDVFSDDYDSSEKCRCPAWTDRVLIRGRKYGDLDWNKFNIVYYGRSEIRSSDHRPVNALVDVDIHVTDATRCGEILEDVLNSLGPSDCTVLVSLEDPDALYAPETYQAIMGIMAHLGEVLMIRYSGVNLCITFAAGVSALNALNYNGTDVMGHQLSVRLRLEEWRAILDKVVDLCKNTATALCDTDESLLLDEAEMSMHIPYSNPSAGGLNGSFFGMLGPDAFDLDIMAGEENKDGGDFAGSLANMALSEAADVDSVSTHSGSSDGTVVSPPIQVSHKAAPPRPPPIRAVKAAPKVKEVIDPWAVTEETPRLIEIPQTVPVQAETLVGSQAPMRPLDLHVNGSGDRETAAAVTVIAETTKQASASFPTQSAEPGAAAPPPPPPPRRNVGQKLPDALIKRVK